MSLKTFSRIICTAFIKIVLTMGQLKKSNPVDDYRNMLISADQPHTFSKVKL